MSDLPQTDFNTALAAKLDGKTKPQGALGRIERIAAQVARLQGRLDPQMERCALVIFAADHGIANEGVSAYPSDVTRQMVLNFARGGAAANVFARVGGMDLSVVNAGVKGGAFGINGVSDHPLGEGTANFLHGPAMTPELARRAIEIGGAIAEKGTYDALAFGEMGIGNTSSATLLAHRLTGAALGDLVGRGTGLRGDGLIHKHDVLSRASARVDGALGPMAALTEFGGFEIAMMAGAMIGAAKAKRFVLVDGFIASTAALVAAGLSQDVRSAMIFCHLSQEAGHRKVLDAMAAEPLLDFDMRLGEGTGAALAWPIVRAAVAMLNDMASFDDAGVSEAL